MPLRGSTLFSFPPNMKWFSNFKIKGFYGSSVSWAFEKPYMPLRGSILPGAQRLKGQLDETLQKAPKFTLGAPGH
jgi:hypothetical protein